MVLSFSFSLQQNNNPTFNRLQRYFVLATHHYSSVAAAFAARLVDKRENPADGEE
jgi:hypothetical protein